MELLSKTYPTKEKTLKGMLARGIQGTKSSCPRSYGDPNRLYSAEDLQSHAICST
jgi:hypothetical protein